MKDGTFQQGLQSRTHFDVWRQQALDGLLELGRDLAGVKVVDQHAQSVTVHGVSRLDGIELSIDTFGASIGVGSTGLFPLLKMRVGTEFGVNVGHEGKVPQFDVSGFRDVQGRRAQRSVTKIRRRMHKVKAPNDGFQSPRHLLRRGVAQEPFVKGDAGFRHDDQIARLFRDVRTTTGCTGVRAGSAFGRGGGGIVGVQRREDFENVWVTKLSAMIVVVQGRRQHHLIWKSRTASLFRQQRLLPHKDRHLLVASVGGFSVVQGPTIVVVRSAHLVVDRER
mmetsp:Transcript_109978/g.164508  ORF Transcript_109978/g.164508 Transcript_109978/m.164508 type:complete len:279 (+) Transcript_109978:1898-2734(+)